MTWPSNAPSPATLADCSEQPTGSLHWLRRLTSQTRNQEMSYELRTENGATDQTN